MMNGKKFVSKKDIYQDKREKLVVEKYLKADGGFIEYLVSYFKPFVIVVPIFNHKSILLLERYSIGTESNTLGFPAGFMEEGESSVQAAQRELFEETGIKALEFTLVAELYENVMRSKQRFSVVIADIEDMTLNMENNPDTNEAKMKPVFKDISTIRSKEILRQMAGAATIAVIPYIENYLEK